ncbi:hypothetical protein K420107F6_36790 [Lactonifactor longoviformis]
MFWTVAYCSAENYLEMPVEDRGTGKTEKRIVCLSLEISKKALFFPLWEAIIKGADKKRIKKKGKNKW